MNCLRRDLSTSSFVLLTLRGRQITELALLSNNLIQGMFDDIKSMNKVKQITKYMNPSDACAISFIRSGGVVGVESRT